MTATDIVLAKLAEAGCNPRRTGRPHQWSARCPVTAAHKRGDRDPSLSVAEGLDGALVTCHAGCSAKDIVEALGLRMADLFDESDAPTDDRRALEAVYDYHDADGTLIMQTLRYRPKSFRQRRPDGNGGWVWNLQGIEERPLYRLPQVLEAVRGGATIWIVEGEKDAEALVAAGHHATCNPMGAGKWRPEHTAWLRGATLVEVVADDDDTGRRHAAAVADALRHEVAEVRTWLPHAGCKDIAEHLGQGRRLSDLRRLEGPTPESPSITSILIDWDEFWREDHTSEEWVAWPLVPAGRQVALFAPAKTGKSIVTLAVVAALAAGWPILGQSAAPPAHVLYLDFEMTRADLYERLDGLGYGPDVDLSHLHYASLPTLPPLNTAEGAAAVLQLALAVGAVVVVVDTTGRAVDGDENDSGPYREFARHTGLALKSHGIALLRTDHAGKDKAKGQRGSSAKNDDVDVVFRLDVVEGGYKLERTHSRVGWVPDKLVILRTEDAGVIEFRAERKARTFLAGTAELGRFLDAHGVDPTWGRKKVGEWLRSQGRRHSNRAIDDALTYRRESGSF